MMRRLLPTLVVLGAGLGATAPAAAQQPGDTVTLSAGPQYAAGPTRRFLNGANWRELWLAPLTVPVLDPGTFAGGLTPERQGGGNQSITLHMVDARGRGWIFRSVDKFLERALPAEMHGHAAGRIVADHVSMLHPGSAFILPPLLQAAGILHVQPQLFVMPDDARLGEFRETFAGMLGALEPKPNEGPDDTPGFAGSRKVKDSEPFLEDLEDGHEHRLDEAEFLRARLVDFLVGDPDRGTDQWRWARFGEDGAYTWRPVPVDRDWALAHADGLLARLARGAYGKLVRFGPRPPALSALTYSTHILDRRLLTRLTRAEVLAEAQRLQLALTDEVIDEAVNRMPRPYVERTGAQLAAALRSRRQHLPELAAGFYEWLASDVDVRATDERDLALIERRADGSVRVHVRPLVPVADDGVNGATVQGAFYDRVFLPDETREVRVYLHGGDDHVRVTGPRGGTIIIRVIGGGGDDVLEDLAGDVRFYDDRGENSVVGAAGTRFNDAPWHPPAAPEGMRANFDWAPDWGQDSGFAPAYGYHSRSGPLVGIGFDHRSYGFRRLPYHWDLDVQLLWAPFTGRAAAELDLDYRMPNSRRSAYLEMAATGLDVVRFHGFGNAAPRGVAGAQRIPITEARFAPGVAWRLGRAPGRRPAADTDTLDAARPRWGRQVPDGIAGRIAIGPAFAWTRVHTPPFATGPEDAPHALARSAADPSVLQLGARATADFRRVDHAAVPRRGYHVTTTATAYPLVSGAGAGGFGTLSAEAALYIPLAGNGPHLALRAGGEQAFGDYPFFAAAYLGGRGSLRGFARDRYAGDAAASGSAELRIPIDSIALLLRAETGVFGFADAGRVWYDGASPGGWHTGFGGGIWIASLGRALSIAAARGEDTRLYAWLGLPF